MSGLIELQKKIGATPDGVFGPGTLTAATRFYKMSKPQAAHFFGQCSHESAHFTVFSENLNYSASGLLRTFPRYFNANTAAQYARKPNDIASKVYANRMGNGSEHTEDGWKFRGRGAIQLTGKSNYILFSAQIKDPEVLLNPDIVAEKYAFESAMFFFTKNRILDMCSTVDDRTIAQVTKKINGGTNGLADRSILTKKYYSWLV